MVPPDGHQARGSYREGHLWVIARLRQRLRSTAMVKARDRTCRKSRSWQQGGKVAALGTREARNRESVSWPDGWPRRMLSLVEELLWSISIREAPSSKASGSRSKVTLTMGAAVRRYQA